ncbi:6438_t:CDS:2, partial [Scutellospora calospora]
HNPHKWSVYFKILNELANKSNKVAICIVCQDTLDDEAKRLTNKANLCYNHLKSCPYFAIKYTKEELDEILGYSNKEQESNTSNSESEKESSSKKAKSVQVDKSSKRKKQTTVKVKDIIAAFKLANSAIQLPLHRKLSRSILKKKVNIAEEQFEIMAKDNTIGITLAFDRWKNILVQKEILITSLENSMNSNNKKIPEDIADIINDSIFWKNLKELDELLFSFCTALTNSKFEDFLANNSPFNTVPFGQFNSDIIKYWTFITHRTHKEIANFALSKYFPNSEELSQESDLEDKQVNADNNNIEWEEFITNWSSLLASEEFEDFEEDFIDIIYPATNLDAKWPLL